MISLIGPTAPGAGGVRACVAPVVPLLAEPGGSGLAGLLGGARVPDRFNTPERSGPAAAAAAADLTPPRGDTTLAAPVGTSTSEFLAELVGLMKASPGERSGERSTIQVRPNVVWPSLSDTDLDVVTFIDEYEDVVGLANDGRGMPIREKLRCFGQSLKQSRAKVYKVVLKDARLKGHLDSDPQRVYADVCVRLLEFRESVLERQNRVEMSGRTS